MNRRYLLTGAGAVAALAATIVLKPGTETETVTPKPAAGQAMVHVKLPPIEGNAAIGARIFEVACASCHGTNAAGIEGVAPPLVHVIYEPGHHADEAFQRAVAMGVKSHHWSFGDMPQIVGLPRGEVAMVIRYIRALQRANGIN